MPKHKHRPMPKHRHRAMPKHRHISKKELLGSDGLFGLFGSGAKDPHDPNSGSGAEFCLWISPKPSDNLVRISSLPGSRFICLPPLHSLYPNNFKILQSPIFLPIIHLIFTNFAFCLMISPNPLISSHDLSQSANIFSQSHLIHSFFEFCLMIHLDPQLFCT
jgi:hypothetical protein